MYQVPINIFMKLNLINCQVNFDRWQALAKTIYRNLLDKKKNASIQIYLTSFINLI